MLRNALRAAAALTVTVGLLSACETEERPEPDPADFFLVNTQPYSYQDLGPVNIAYEVVARYRGWSEATIGAWRDFLVNDVIAKESGGCYNVRGGVQFADGGAGCAIARQGRRQDSGFGQLVAVHYQYPNGWLCQQEGLCSADALTENAWNSMSGLLALVERGGKQGWCYDARARNYHRGCATAPSNFSF